MSQGSEGSPVLFLDLAACDDILADLREADGSLPTFDSDPRSPPPTLEAEVTHGERSTQTSPVPTHDQSTSVLIVLAPVPMSDQATQVISRPHQAASYTQTPLRPLHPNRAHRPSSCPIDLSRSPRRGDRREARLHRGLRSPIYR